MADPSILLVDDHVEDLLVLASILGKLDVRLVKATSGKSALRMVLREDFALIILDIHLSDMSGIDVASMVRLRSRTSRTPIIFTSAFSNEEIMHRYRLAPTNLEFVSKPFDVPTLLKKVHFFLNNQE